MDNYNVTDIQKLFEEHGITRFNVINVCENDKGILIHVKQKEKLIDYLQSKPLTYLKFKSGNLIYEVHRFYVNIDGKIRVVYVLKKENLVVQLLSQYEINNYKDFAYFYIDLKIDKILEEDY